MNRTFSLFLYIVCTCLVQAQATHCFEFYEEGSTDSTSFLYEWELGDGTKKKGQKVRHCYTSPGSYHVVLNVLDINTGELLKEQASYDLLIRGKSAAAFNNEGVRKDREKDYTGALAAYDKAIALKPDYAKAYFNRGLTKGKLKDFTGSIADHSKAIELDSAFAEPWHYRGIMEFYMGEKEKACADLHKAAEMGFEKSKESLRKLCSQ